MKSSINKFNTHVFLFLLALLALISFFVYEKEKNYTYNTIYDMVSAKICTMSDIIKYHEDVGSPDEIPILVSMYIAKTKHLSDFVMLKNNTVVIAKNNSCAPSGIDKKPIECGSYADVENGAWIVKKFPTKSGNYEILYRLDTKIIQEKTKTQVFTFLAEMGVILILSFAALTFVLNKVLVRPISKLAEYMKTKKNEPKSFFFTELELLKNSYVSAVTTLDGLNKTLEEQVQKRTIQLKQSNETLKNIIDRQQNCVIVIEEGKVKVANKRFLSLFGFKDLTDVQENFQCISELFLADSTVCTKTDTCSISKTTVIEDSKLKFTPTDSDELLVYKIDKTVIDKDSTPVTIISLSDITDLENEKEALELKSNTDALTSLKNRRYFDKILEAEVHKAKSKNIPLSLIMFDIDRFKNINDTYGHQVGDEALRGLAKTVSAHIRQSDVLARYGGEEFAVIASWTNIDAAKILAEKLRKTIEELKLPDVPQFTCSFGVAQMEEEDFTHDIIKRADDALYEAKNSGRNIVIAKGESR